MFLWKALAAPPCMLALALAQSSGGDYLTPQEIAAAQAAPANTGYAYMVDQDLSVASKCTTRAPSEGVYTATGWINAMAQVQKKQFLPVQPPGREDTRRVLTVISKGCIGAGPSGPVCDTITRVVLASDKGGSVVAEAGRNTPTKQTWTDGNGASAECGDLMSEFTMDDVKKVRNAKGEFTIATFAGDTPLKMYVVKDKYQKKLGI